MKIKTALASFGMSGQLFHAPFLHTNPSFDFAYVLERNQKKCKTHYPNVISFDNWDQILTSDATLVIVNTPTYLHYQMAKDVLLAGKNVVIEKPVCSSVFEMQELMELAQEKKLLLNVYHNMRFEGEVKTAKKLIEEGILGEIIGFEAYFDRYRTELGTKFWKESPHLGAGLVYDIGSHLIDQVFNFFGETQNIQSTIEIQREVANVPDYFNIEFNYPTFTATIGASMLMKNPRPKLYIQGTKASYFYNTFDPQENQLKNGMLPTNPLFGHDTIENYGTLQKNDGSITKIPTEQGNYMEYYNNLANVLMGNCDDVLIKNQEALKVIEIIEMVYAQNNFKLDGKKK